MGVSRSTLREAIAALRAAGMVRTTRGRGGGSVVAFRPPTAETDRTPATGERREQLLDSLVFRRIVEPGAACLAASRQLGAAQRMLLTMTLAEVDQAPDSGAHRQADLASVTGSPLRVAAVTVVLAGRHDMLRSIPVLEPNIAHSTRQHRAIVGAILAGESAKARRAMEQHCDDTAALLRGLLG
jgi:GntR family transcriptional regulator, transcriptional repressor for pyruvate dehydrogenase complex